ncbi:MULTISPECIES: hypothetical protein [Streptomyces]|uniref:hypothetical protein n=1 Tax=Streptomyces TaxID=1883 RepID=UPI00117C0CD5|nr:hypothetical protein [Streptomyces kasugaensis]
MSTAPLDVAGPHLAALVEQLKKAGAIRSARWAEAFAAVPPHVFVPRWYERETNGKGISVWRIRPPLHEGKLPEICHGLTLVTVLGPSIAEQVAALPLPPTAGARTARRRGRLPQRRRRDHAAPVPKTRRHMGPRATHRRRRRDVRR